MKPRDDGHLAGDIKHEAGAGDPFAAAVRARRVPMVITDPARPDNNPIIFCNQAFQDLTGYDARRLSVAIAVFRKGRTPMPMR